MARPTRTMAPPTPHTTPITVLFVLEDMLEEDVWFWERPGELVAFAAEVVYEDSVVTVLPEMFVTLVTTTTLAELLSVGVGVGVGVGVAGLDELEEEEVTSCVLEEVGVGVALEEEGVGVGVGVGVVVVLADVLLTLADEVVEVVPDPVPNNPPKMLVPADPISESTSFFCGRAARRWKRLLSNQLACASATKTASRANTRSCRANMLMVLCVRKLTKDGCEGNEGMWVWPPRIRRVMIQWGDSSAVFPTRRRIRGLIVMK